MKFGHKVLLLGGAVAVGYGLLAWYLPAAARKKEQAALATRLDAIEGSLAQLLERGEEVVGDGAVQPREAGMRKGPRTNEERLAEALERLIETLEAQAALLASQQGAAASLDVLRARYPEPDVQALEGLHAAWSADRDTLRDGLQLLSRVEVLTRFGAPSEVAAGNWTWDWTSSADERRRLVLSFDGDYVHDARFSR